MMLRKLISASLACLLIFSCTAGVLAAPPEQMDPLEAIAPEEAVDSAYTYDENGILTEYVEPIPDLTDEENAYDKLIAFYGAAGLPCDITYENFLDCFAASGLEYIEDYLVQCIDELYETYSLDEDIDSGKAQPVFSQSEQSLEETLQQAYIAVTEYSEYLGMPMMTDFETFCAQYASSGLYDVEVYRDHCKDEIYAAFLRTEEGMVPPEEAGSESGIPATLPGTMTDAMIEGNYDTYSIGDGFKKEYEEVPEDISTQTKPSARFTDISNHWAYSAISYMLNNGLMSGMTAYKFEPNTNITRAMFVSLLYRLAGRPNVSLSASSSNSFSDVRDQNSYYYYAVAWASSNGIVSGYTDGTFKPDNLVTREQCASFLYRFARYKNLNLNYSNSSLNQFTDVGQVSSYALIPMKWAVSRGIMSRTTTTTLSPQTTCTRAMSAQLLKKLSDTLM